MGDWNQSIGSLGDRTLGRLAEMLDNPPGGWRQLANVVTMEQPRFSCSETELTRCSLEVMSPTGSSGRYLLAKLADRNCSLGFLLHCLKKMDHQGAVRYLTTTVTEQVRIVMHPQSQQVSEGGRVVLMCKASGPAGLSYQWFRGKEEILGGTGSAPELVLCPLSPLHVGHYICRVNHGENCIFSQWAQVSFLHNSDPVLFPDSVSGLRVICQPLSQTLSEGDTLFLMCSAAANPPAQYQWHHNMQPMAQRKEGTLRIPCVTTRYRGQYSCRVFNLYHETWSDTVHVDIGPSSISDISCWSEVDSGTGRNVRQQQKSKAPVTPVSPNPATRHEMSLEGQVGPDPPTDKVALLIGNMNYRYLTPLRAPMADVHELTNELRQLDFKVVSLLDLDCQEMHSAVTEFLLLLDKGVYGLLYFAGHGYENFGNSFMVPIDAPASHTSEHCVCVQNVLQRMQERETGLNVFLLDMCRKRNPNDEVATQSRPLKVTANIVFGYATCVDAEAFEEQREELSCGIFIKYLKKRIREDEKVTYMLDKVAEDMGRYEFMRGRQALELRSNLSERRTLADRIRSSDCPAATSARNLQWAIAHVLPESRSLQFDCGVKVQLGFAAEYSNIMIIYTRILEKPKNITSCSAQLTDFSDGPAVDLKKSNQESLAEAGSFCLLSMVDLPSPDVPSLYTRLQSLQRLKTELTFTVCLHYRYTNLDEEVQEQQTISVGKPLVSKLNLHQARLPHSSSASSSRDPNSFSLPESSSSFAEDFGTSLQNSETSSIGSASTTWSYYHPDSTASVTSPGIVNVPEENDDSEWFDSDAPKPLSASKSLPYSQRDDNNYRFSHAYDFHSS